MIQVGLSKTRKGTYLTFREWRCPFANATVTVEGMFRPPIDLDIWARELVCETNGDGLVNGFGQTVLRRDCGGEGAVGERDGF